MGLKDVAASLPPGFRFHPSDQELLSHYLYQKITSDRLSKGTLVEVDLHKCEPWQLPDVAKFGENEWYFFNFRDRKYATGFRINRATTCGYWKATGKDRPIFDPSSGLLIGMRKTLVFYHERAPNGIKTGWVMHEFRLEGPHTPPKEDWVLCRVFEKSKCEAPSSKFSSGWSSNQGLESSPPNVDQTVMPPSSTFPHQDLPNCNTLLNSPILHFCSYGFPSTQLGDTPPFITDHEYDFLLDMGLENHNVEGLQI